MCGGLGVGGWSQSIGWNQPRGSRVDDSSAAGCSASRPTPAFFSPRHPFPRVFNRCNRRELDRYLQSGGGMCLSNMPDTRTLYGGRRCGNGYLEDGEECDCGEEEVRLRGGALVSKLKVKENATEIFLSHRRSLYTGGCERPHHK